MMGFVYLFLATVVFCTADLLAKYWGETQWIVWIIGACSLGSIAYIFIGLSMKTMNLAVVVAVFNCFSILLMSGLGYWIFGETLNGMQWAGVGFSIIGVWFFYVS